MQTAIIKVKPKLQDDKPGKDEVVRYFRACTKQCLNCDTKRSSGCCSPS